LTREVCIIDAGEATRLGPDAFPLALGGPQSGVPVAGLAASAPSGWIGLAEGELFVQPSGTGAPILCNGGPVTASQWLRDGDQLRIGSTRVILEIRTDAVQLRVEPVDDDELTEPPLPPRVASSDLTPPNTAPSTDTVAIGTRPGGATVAPVAFTPRTVATERRAGLRIRPLTVLTWIVIAGLCAVAWLLFTARSIEVIVEPPADRVKVEGGLLRWQFGGRWILRPGSYTVSVERAGYRSLDRTVEIDADSSGTLTFVLEKLPGRLAIETGGLVGAQVLIDGEAAGRTPLEPLELAAGEYEVRIEAERHADFATQVTIVGEGEVYTLDVALQPLWAPVTIRSRPAGAAVRIDDRPFGVTPTTVDLLEGQHSVRLSLSGYQTRRGRVSVVAGQPLEPAVFTLVPAEGMLKLQSEPSGATVTVNDEYRGQTPIDLDLEPGQSHRLEVSKAGHATAEREVVVASGDASEWTATLEVLEGEVEVAARPPDAELIVDGESLGRADQTLTLAVRLHEIEIRKPGFVSYHTTITPRPEFPLSIDVTLKTIEQLQAESRPPEITTSQGQPMVLIEGGRFRMGASRREPGRRANESLHDVELTRAFYLSTTEVSNYKFRQFRRTHFSGKVGSYNLEIDHHPVVRVTWVDAVQYCNWLSAAESLPPAYVNVGGTWVVVRPPTIGYRLPTEAEWALAARFPDGGTDSLKYPWGDSLPAVDGSGNFADESTDGLLKRSLSGYNDAYPATAPVKSFEPNALGLFNMGGNVAEWVQDIYTIYPSGSGEVLKDPLGPTEGELHVIRGSSWMDSSISELRMTYRDYGTDARPDLGFRLARYAE